MIGLYPLSNVTTPVDYGLVSAFLASESATVATTLPNGVLSSPSYTTPTYSFNTSVPWEPGQIVSSELATSTYSPVFGGSKLKSNDPSIPMISLSPTVATFIVTESGGAVVTQTSTVARSSDTLGKPPGWNGATSKSRAPTILVSLALSTSFILFFFHLIP